jgi:threonine dehydrogenase-like Zn-dependent dehydrogenase
LFAPRLVVAYGIREEELDLARLLGADVTVLVGEEDAEAATRALGGLDLVLETAGAVAAVELSTRLVREGGRVVLLGIAGEGKLLEIPADRIVLRDLSLVGSVSYTTAVWSRFMALLGTSLFDLQPVVTHRFRADEFERAFELMERREGIVGKVVLEHAS